MKTVFMGTPEFAASILKALKEAGHEITAVYTQPDKPQGRSGALIAPPVKVYAEEKGIPVYQPVKIKAPESVEVLKTIPADVYVVAAYGQILSQEILDIPKFGCINVHGSLLPKLRGAAPIQRAIANGDRETGVSIMKMDKGMDTGAVYSSVSFPIEPEDNEDSVYLKMADYGAKELLKVLKDVEAGTAVATPQDHDLATYAPPLKKEEGLIDFGKSAESIDCLVRGFLKWPTAYTTVNGKLLKIFGTKVIDSIPNVDTADYEPGALIVTKKNVYVSTGSGILELLEVQLEGKKRMSACDFVRGMHLGGGDFLGQ